MRASEQGQRLYPAYRPARPPPHCPPASTGGVLRLIRRDALAASRGFSTLLDVRRPDDRFPIRVMAAAQEREAGRPVNEMQRNAIHATL
jgi:hypothetical protein